MKHVFALLTYGQVSASWWVISSVQLMLYDSKYVVSCPNHEWFQLVSSGFDVQHGSPALVYWFTCGGMSH